MPVLADQIPDAVQWHEGMLLTPQHFQQSDSRHEALVQYGTLAIDPYCWGVRRLTFDTELLPTGIFRVLDLEAVMPDGLVARYANDVQRPLDLDLNPHIGAMKSDNVTVHLAVATRAVNEMNGSLSRFEAYEGPPVRDANTGEGDLRLPRLRPRLILLASEEPPAKYVSFPLVKLRFRDEAVTAADFIPPTTAVRLDSPLGIMCSQLAARIREKAMLLAERVRSLEDRFRVHSLVAGLPQFEAVLGTGLSHPYPLYLALCSLAGQLSALGNSMAPPVFDMYRHADLRRTFTPVLDYAARMLAEGVPETYAAHPFEFKEGGFSRLFDGAWATKRLILGLRLPTGVSEREMITWSEQCLIGSESVIPSLRDKRILGAGRQFIEREGDLSPARGVVFFVLSADPQFVKAGEVLRIVGLGERGLAFRPLEIVLYVSGLKT